MGKTELFVLGCPHSGTTRFAYILNENPDICIGIERCASFLQRTKRLPKDLFQKERFFGFEDVDAKRPDNDPRWKRLYDDLELRWDEASVVGDKLPSLFMFFPQVLEDFPSAKFISLSKNIYQVARSWDKRSERTGNNYKDGVKRWNRANVETLKAIENQTGNWLVVQVEKFFDGRECELQRVTDFLGVALHSQMLADFREASQRYQNAIKESESTFVTDSTKLDDINTLADFETYNTLLKYA
ncbi:MAG: hypothetical protein AcusKO_29550 [Acuticoccus sp.]